ncbi:MAG: twin-arginine translocase TatA/TatE family subunit [Dehalococcoidales bacterium]|nr:twin-arginine translocase TatA/TatE family subunit [Dehalococcoidales bacterium]
MFRQFGPLEIGLIVLIILIVFGVGKLPQVGSALGKGIRAFRRGQSGASEDEEETEPEPKPVSKKKVSKKTTNKKSS